MSSYYGCIETVVCMLMTETLISKSLTSLSPCLATPALSSDHAHGPAIFPYDISWMMLIDDAYRKSDSPMLFRNGIWETCSTGPCCNVLGTIILHSCEPSPVQIFAAGVIFNKTIPILHAYRSVF